MLYRTILAALCVCAASPAALVRVEVQERSVVLGGQTFGKSGAYERVLAKAYFAVDPKASANAGITDLDKAPRNAEGLVEFSADLYFLKPVDLKLGNGTVLYEAPNRGGKGMLSMFNRARSALDLTAREHFGDGQLLAAGYTLAWLGWQHDVPQRPGVMRLYAPVAKGVIGLVRSEFVADRPVSSFSLGDSGHLPFPARDAETAVLTVRDGIDGTRQPVDRELWQISNRTQVQLRRPAQPGRIYEVVYESEDPSVAELGLAAIRDLISFLKYTEVSHRHAIGFGVSQSAMVLRALVYEGFNEDEKGRQVFDGIFSHVAGGRRSTFQRFAQPSRTAGPLRNASFSSTDQFPYSDVSTKDWETGRTAGLLAGAVPKIFHTNSSYEYWGSAGSLLHTTVDGKKDLDLPSTSRIYMFSGGQHGPASFPPAPSRGQNLPNFNDYRWILRALLPALQAWVAEDKQPPRSVYPTVAARTLVPSRKYAFPAIPQVQLPRAPHSVYRLDFGPLYLKKGIVAVEPPRLGEAFTTLIPQADTDGNDMGGVKMPAIEVPLGTFTGWNLRSPSIGAPGELLGNTGSYIPFAATKAKRLEKGDPRLSVEERYGNQDEYLKKVRAAADGLVQAGFLLPGDVLPVVDAAKRHWAWAALVTK